MERAISGKSLESVNLFRAESKLALQKIDSAYPEHALTDSKDYELSD